MSGPAASWGLVNKVLRRSHRPMTKGGEDRADTYKIEIVPIDDKNDPKLTVSGAERLTQQDGIKYIIGPNIDTTAASIGPSSRRMAQLYFPYAFSKSLYTPPASNSVLGMIASYQAGPIIYKYMMENRGVKSVTFVARNESDALNQRKEGVEAAKEARPDSGVRQDTYEPGTTDFFPVMSKVVAGSPDLIVLSGVAPADAPTLIRAARELGFKGTLSTETAQDVKVLNEVAGDTANGFVSVGGASTPAIRSPYMEEFAKEYAKVAGEWNDEAGTKVYARGDHPRDAARIPKRLNDVARNSKRRQRSFGMANPFLKDKAALKFVGRKYFGQPRQIGVPVVGERVQERGIPDHVRRCCSRLT